MNTNITRTNLVYFSMILIIGMISAYDNTLSFIYADCLKHTEENPMGRYLIDHYGVYSFIYYKMIGTLSCTALMFSLVKPKYRYVISYIFAFQLWLFYYVTFSSGEENPNWTGVNHVSQAIEFYYEYWSNYWK